VCGGAGSRVVMLSVVKPGIQEDDSKFSGIQVDGFTSDETTKSLTFPGETSDEAPSARTSGNRTSWGNLP